MEFIGNKKVVSQLSNSLKSGKLNHAYIFSGPEKVGKFALAKNFTTSLIKGIEELILDTSFRDNNALLDLIFVEPEVIEKNEVRKQRDISIETIREAKRKLSLFPYCGRYKILIIRDAHKMNNAAQNGLLKILEEPNETTKIILVTHESDRILPTIYSRCQVVNFGLVSDQELVQAFSNDIADFSLGRPGNALELSEGGKKEFAQESLSQLNMILNGSINEKLTLADQLSKNVVTTLERMNLWQWEIRKKALLTGGIEKKFFDKVEKIKKSADLLKQTNANARLVLESLFIDL